MLGTHPASKTSRSVFQITEKEQQGLVEACKATFAELPRVHGVAVMGSSPDGVGEQTHKDVSVARYSSLHSVRGLGQTTGFEGGKGKAGALYD